MGLQLFNTAKWRALVNKFGTSEVSGTGTLVGFGALSEGEMVAIEADHAAFNTAEPPRFDDVNGAAFFFDASYSNGERFRVIAMKTAATGSWSGGDGDLAYTWTRRGSNA